MNIPIISAILSLLVGIIYTLLALALPNASIGVPYEPKIFPMGLGIILIIISFILLIQETFKQSKEKKKTTQEKNGNKFNLNNDLVKILLTCLFALIYALLFNKLGYVISTFVFLQTVLWLFNGIKGKKWITNSIVSGIFSISIYILFSVVLGVYLPKLPGF